MQLRQNIQSFRAGNTCTLLHTQESTAEKDPSTRRSGVQPIIPTEQRRGSVNGSVARSTSVFERSELAGAATLE